MYLPMELNSPLVLGAAVAGLLRHSSPDEKTAGARHEEGTLIASGFIAGGALVGVFSALLRFFEDRSGTEIVPDLTKSIPFLADWGNWLGLAAFGLLGLYVYMDSMREKPQP
jgi:hypothetical protein